MNLIGATGKATRHHGQLRHSGYEGSKKYGEVRIAASSEDRNHTYIPSQDKLTVSPDASYFYYCANNTIYGTEWKYIPETGGIPLVTDMSSNILSKPIDVSKYGIIFAGAQKNMAPASHGCGHHRQGPSRQELAITPEAHKLQGDD